MRDLRRVFVVVAAAMLAACSAVKANVEAYSTMTNAYIGKTIAVVPYAEQQGSLEFASHARKLEAKLAQAGMKVIPFDPDGVRPDYAAFIDFSIDGGRKIPVSYTTDIWGPTGVQSSSSSGTLSTYGNSGLYSGTTTYQQSYGVVGQKTHTGSRTEYARELYLDIMQLKPAGDAEQVYEGRLVSSGTCGNLGAVMDSLLAAMFKNFPHPTSGEVMAPPPDSC